MQPATNNNGEILNEFELIARLSELDSAKNLECDNTVLIGIGDDAAVVSTPASQMLLTTDAIVDGVHFRSVDERWFERWNQDPYEAQGGGDGRSEGAGVHYLLPYWMGRYHDAIAAP